MVFMDFGALILNKSFILLLLLLLVIIYIYYLSIIKHKKSDDYHPTQNNLNIEQLEEKLQNGEITIKEYVSLLEELPQNDYRK